MFFLLGCSACSGKAEKEKISITIATTTSVEDSGLLDVILPAFSEKYGIGVKVVAIGTGRALKYGENGD
ncbi:MAG: tungsten ABC transporter substrate-binding protein, partial [Planctomycetota bacterium]|nr:tungsten ABC transporter substrate-binding protein [Planctomycetota bacterium]